MSAILRVGVGVIVSKKNADALARKSADISEGVSEKMRENIADILYE